MSTATTANTTAVNHLTVGERYAVKMGNWFDAGGSWVEEMELMEVDESGVFTQYFFASKRGVAQATLAPVNPEDSSAGEYLSCTCLLPLPMYWKAAAARLPSGDCDKFTAKASHAKLIKRSNTHGGDRELIALATV